ncbi:uncharacterized protein CBL_02384 [Carabus blaptoides fortunei]
MANFRRPLEFYELLGDWTSPKSEYFNKQYSAWGTNLDRIYASGIETGRQFPGRAKTNYEHVSVGPESYGSVAPRTAWGKLVTILYALIGIPLMLIYLSTTGDVLARSFRRLYGKLCGTTPVKASGGDCPCSTTVKVPITLCLVLVLGYICCGAVLFHRLENWSMLEGSYFCFTSLGTIGFGDLVPGQHAEEISLCACSIYILAGMALIAMCVSLVQEEASSLLRLIGATCGAKPRTQEQEEIAMNTPARRSVGAEPLVEYFVPRSVSEFDLSITNDIPLLNPRIAQHQKNKLAVKSREKMVTFEDEMAGRKNPLEDVFM